MSERSRFRALLDGLRGLGGLSDRVAALEDENAALRRRVEELTDVIHALRDAERRQLVAEAETRSTDS
jgi:hypothetical protein